MRIQTYTVPMFKNENQQKKLNIFTSFYIIEKKKKQYVNVRASKRYFTIRILKLNICMYFITACVIYLNGLVRNANDQKYQLVTYEDFRRRYDDPLQTLDAR